VQVWSVIGREFTLATNQVDFAVPRRFGLTYRDKDNTEKNSALHSPGTARDARAVHRFLIEHYAGNFPLWLAPEQVRVLTVGEDERLSSYAREIVNELRSTSFAPRAISALTRSTVKSRKPNKRRCIPCWSWGLAIWMQGP
jgi:threonyl-tRNA synthetase